MTDPNPINPLDKHLATIANAVNAWQKENTAEKLAENVKQELDKQAREIMLLLLGFNRDSFSRADWRIDNCNGRQAGTAVGQFLATHQAEAIKEWLTKTSLPELTPALKKKLQTTAQAEYSRQFEYHICQAARAQAERDAQELVKQLSESKQISNYLKTMALINNESSSNQA